VASLTTESFTDDIPYHPRYGGPNNAVIAAANHLYERLRRMGRLSVQKPYYSHDRTIVTVIVLICGTLLLWHYGDSSPIVALVSAGWTLALTFWFRFGADPESGDR
jgi:hypothetical protein